MTVNRSCFSFVSLLLLLAIIFAILTQCFLDSLMLRALMYISWVLLFAYMLLCKQFRFRISKNGVNFVVLATLLFAYVLIQSFFSNFPLSSGYFRGCFLVLFIYLIGVLLANIKTSSIILPAIVVYVIATLFFANYLFFTYVGSILSFYSSQVYMIQQKNSAGQIISIAILIILSLENDNGKIIKTTIIVSIIFLFFLIVTQCRSSMLGLCIALVYFFLKKKIKHKYLYLFCFILVCSILFGDSILSLLAHSLRLEQYTNASLDTISSGRISLIAEALKTFALSPLWGVGAYYVDMFFVGVFTELGLLGGAIVIAMYCLRIKENFKFEDRKCNISKSLTFNYALFFKQATLFYLCISCFEAAPPFGPGVSCCIFWIFAGYFDNFDLNNSENYNM